MLYLPREEVKSCKIRSDPGLLAVVVMYATLLGPTIGNVFSRS